MKFHTFIAINPRSYDSGLVTRLNDVYASMGKLHISIMGPKTKEVLPLLPKEFIETITEITAPTFNYAYAINRSMKALYTKKIIDDESLLVLTDSWNAISLLQMEYQLKDVDFSTSFVHTEIYRDAIEEELNKNSRRYMLSILTRLKASKEMKRPKPQKVIPIPILSGKQYVMAGGLEERMFTDISRLYMMEFLKKAGATEVMSTQDGLRLSYEPVYAESQCQMDMHVFNSLRSIEDGKLSLPANVGYEWGSPERIKFLRLENDVPMWTESYASKNITSIKKPESAESTEVFVSKPRLVPMKPKIPISGFEAKLQKTLIAIKNDIKDMAMASNLLKETFLQYGPVTILTDRKMFPAIDMIDSFMVKEIIDLPMYHASPIDFSQFKKLFRFGTFTRSIEIPGVVDYEVFEGDHNPYCNSPVPTRKIPQSSVCFSITANGEGYRKTSQDMWELISKVSEKLISYNIPVFLLGYEKERVFVQNVTVKHSGSPRISVATDRDVMETCSIINFCKTVVTHPETNMFWLSYALKKNTVVVSNKKGSLPNVHWLQYIDYDEEDAADKIVKMVVQNL